MPTDEDVVRPHVNTDSSNQPHWIASIAVQHLANFVGELFNLQSILDLGRKLKRRV